MIPETDSASESLSYKFEFFLSTDATLSLEDTPVAINYTDRQLTTLKAGVSNTTAPKIRKYNNNI